MEKVAVLWETKTQEDSVLMIEAVAKQSSWWDSLETAPVWLEKGWKETPELFEDIVEDRCSQNQCWIRFALDYFQIPSWIHLAHDCSRSLS